MGLRSFIGKQFLMAAVTILAVIVINFFLFRVMPANPIDILLSPRMGQAISSPEIRRALEHEFGLDRPLYEQFFVYLGATITGNLGSSFTEHRVVVSILAERTLNTLTLMISAELISILAAVVLGVLAAWKRGSKTDVSNLITALTFSSMPIFWVGGILIIIFSVELNMFPMYGTTMIGAVYSNIFEYIIDYARHLFLPMFATAIVTYGGLFLIMRSSLLDVFQEDYMLTARAIGLSNRTIIFKNALSNAMLPLITIIAIRTGFMISGALLTETLFSWPGLGWTIYNAVNQRDYPILQGAFLVITILVVISNLIAEIIYGFADPRVRSSATTV